ncbi:MAG TPA: hypothetical protein VFR85_13675 [Anaeromyxobacteraceae bacterium]|nr:hypothetical protein [Anaeromyxobacteraceae bacterium]
MDSTQPMSPPVPHVDLEAVGKKLHSGANWFFWIAGLSLANTGMTLAGSDRNFVVGLAVTQVADAFAKVALERGGPASFQYLAVGFDVLVAGLFAAAGLLARRKVAWVYVAGMILYLLDAALCGVFQVWMSLAFHALALFYLWSGFSALRTLRAAAAPRMAVNRLVR